MSNPNISSNGGPNYGHLNETGRGPGGSGGSGVKTELSKDDVGGGHVVYLGTPKHIVTNVETDSHGLTTGRVTIKKQEGPLPTKLPSIFDAPYLLGVPCIHVVRGYAEGWAEYVYDYEGGKPSEATYEEVIKFTYDFDTSMAEENIQTHPNFKNLADDYGWDAQKKEFSQYPIITSPGGKDSKNALKKATIANGFSRMYGVEAFLVPGAILRVQYIIKYVPPHILQNIGEIVALPGGVEKVLSKTDADSIKTRTWLRLAPKVNRHGNVYQVSEEFMLSRQDGWIRDVYTQDALKGKRPADGESKKQVGGGYTYSEIFSEGGLSPVPSRN